MKNFIKVFIIFSIALLTSCNREDREPLITPLSIHRQFKTETMHVKLSDIDSFTGYEDELFIVNSITNLPEDIYFSVEDFKRADINFSEYSLVVVYQLIPGDIVNYKYGWEYNNWYERYQFCISLDKIKDSEYINGETDNFNLTYKSHIYKKCNPCKTYSIELRLDYLTKYIRILTPSFRHSGRHHTFAVWNRPIYISTSPCRRAGTSLQTSRASKLYPTPKNEISSA